MTEDEDNISISCRSSPASVSSVITPRGRRGQRYKTELCRQFEENGTCCYGARCQFAHGSEELRSVARHPKYKTDLCRTFHTTGLCPYGPRCHFIHNDDDRRMSVGPAFGLESLRTQPAPLMNVGIEFEVDQHLLGLVLLTFDSAVTVPHHAPYPLYLIGSDHQPSASHLVNKPTSRSCGSTANSSRSTSFGDIFSWTLVE